MLICDVYAQLLSGGHHDIDVDDLRNNTRYTGGYTEGSRTVKLFWEVYELAVDKSMQFGLLFPFPYTRGVFLLVLHLYDMHCLDALYPTYMCFATFRA